MNNQTKLIMYTAMLLLILIIMVLSIIYIIKKAVGSSGDNEKSDTMFSSSKHEKHSDRKLFKEKNLKSIIAMDGVDPNPLSYFTINDKGRDCYIRTFTVNTLPKHVQFATSFAPLFDFDDCISSVFIQPVAASRSIRQLDNKIVKIEADAIEAEKDRDRNKVRKTRGKLNSAEAWIRNIEAGENRLYEVGFLFSIMCESLEELNLRSNKLVLAGRNKDIELCSCYGVHPEAFLSNGPFNHIYSLAADNMNMIKSSGIVMQTMDKYSLSTIFHHTTSSFSHRYGIPAGRIVNTAEPLLYDPYDKSHNGYGVIFAGMTGTGKSATMKMYISRLYHQHYYFVCIDSDKKGGRGEFSNVAERLSGVSYQIKNGSQHRINPFDISEQLEWDEPTDTEYRALRLSDKIANLTHIIMSLICGEKNNMDFTMEKAIRSIVNICISRLYDNHGIQDGNPDSIYEMGKVLDNGILVDGLVKKQMPTLSDFYMEVVRRKKIDKEKAHEQAYTVILDAVGDWVVSIRYNSTTLEVISPEDYERMVARNDEALKDVVHIKGTKHYFDGQSTINYNEYTRFVNIDISDLPKDDIPIAQEFACNFVEENFMKRNSENPKKAKKMVVICDEAHRMFKNKLTCDYLSDWYRVARKRHISVWTCSQGLIDFSENKQTEAILANATSKFLFKQAAKHEEYLKKATNLTDSQIQKLLSIGGDPDDEDDVSHKGECCLIDNNRTVFIKVDYLSTEQYIVETNIAKLKEMYA